MPVPQNEIPAAEVNKWTGLYRSVNPAALPPGALYQADNVVVAAPSVLSPRRGFRAGTDVSGGRNRIKALSFFGDYALFLDNTDTTSVTAQNTVYPNQFSDWFDIPALWAFGTPQYTDLDLSPPTLSRFGFNTPAMTPPNRFFAANGNMYLGTNFGALRISAAPGSLASTPTQIAGLQRPPPPVVNVQSDANGFLGAYQQCAYRLTFKWTDEAGNEHVSPPSERVVARETTNYTASKVELKMFSIPDWYENQDIICQIWRTKTVQNTAADVWDDISGDEMFLIAEIPLTAATAEIVNIPQPYGYISPSAVWDYFDFVPDVPWLVDPLYTNPTTGDVNQLGLGNANTPPPAAYDIATFRGYTYYANTEEVQRLQIQIIGTGTGGIQVGDTITIQGITFEFNQSTLVPFPVGTYPGNLKVPLYTIGGPGGLNAPTVEECCHRTAEGLATIISGALTSAFYGPTVSAAALKTHIRAEYASPVNGQPGLIQLERLIPGGAAFSVTPGTGAGRGWAGTLTGATSDSNRQPANLMQSHFNDPESVPPAFTRTVGRKERPILRVLPLRDSSFVFKGQGDGLWRFTDDGEGNLNIAPLDQTVHCIAPETVASLNNAAYALCDKGVLRITDGGSPENLSNERIQNDLALIVANAGANITRAFAVAYEAERMYILCLPISATDTTCDVQYVYSELTDSWTRWTVPGLVCGGINPTDGTLCFGRDIATHEGNLLWVERKTFTDLDYQDETFTRGVPGVGSYTSNTLTFSGDLRTTYHVGDLFQYNPPLLPLESFLVRVTDVTWNVGANQTVVTLDGAVDWTAGDPFTQYTGIPCVLQLLPLTDDLPLYEKQWQNVYFYFRRETFDQCVVGFSTEKQPNPLEYDLAGSPELQFLWSEQLGFGLQPWGQHSQDVILKLALDQASARSSDLTLRWGCRDARSSWQLSAIRVPYDPSTLRLVR